MKVNREVTCPNYNSISISSSGFWNKNGRKPCPDLSRFEIWYIACIIYLSTVNLQCCVSSCTHLKKKNLLAKPSYIHLVPKDSPAQFPGGSRQVDCSPAKSAKGSCLSSVLLLLKELYPSRALESLQPHDKISGNLINTKTFE